MTGDAKLPGISVVVPVYNSEGSLPELVRRLDAPLAPLAGAWEIILVKSWSSGSELEFGSSRELGVREPGQF